MTTCGRHGGASPFRLHEQVEGFSRPAHELEKEDTTIARLREVLGIDATNTE